LVQNLQMAQIIDSHTPPPPPPVYHVKNAYKKYINTQQHFCRVSKTSPWVIHCKRGWALFRIWLQKGCLPIYNEGGMAHKMNRRCILLFLYNHTSCPATACPKQIPPVKLAITCRLFTLLVHSCNNYS